MIEQHSLMNDHAQPQNNIQMNFASHQGNIGSSGGHGYTQEQIEALKRHHAQVQAGRNSDSNSPVPATTRSQAGNGNSSNTNQQNGGNGPFMVLTQVAVPAHMVGQLNNNMPNQLQQLLQQQQQQQGKSSNQPQILSFNQLPSHVQQQILLQQQQQQLQQGQGNGNPQQQQQQSWQQSQQQQQQQQNQQSKGGLGNLNVADLQALLKNNQIDSNLMQQILASQMNKNNNNHNSDRQSQNSNDMTDNSMSDMFGSFHDPSAENDVNNEISSHKRMFLETQVQPVHRQLDSYSDDDLFKIFDMEVGEDDSGVEDVLSPSAFSNGRKPNEMVCTNNT
jgi:hypothetical protein